MYPLLYNFTNVQGLDPIVLSTYVDEFLGLITTGNNVVGMRWLPNES